MKTHLISLFGLLFLLCSSAWAQRVENLNAVLVDDNIEITYDLIDEVGNRTFDLQVFSSHDNYASPLQEVTGDVGEEIEPGTDKKIIWHAKEELGDFRGEIFVEIRGIITPPFVRILTPNAGDKVKRGKDLEITWDSDLSGDFDIDLYRNGTKVSDVAETSNTGAYTWTLGKKMNKGEGYYLVFGSDAKPGKEVQSQQFVVAGGFPVWLAAGGAAVIGGVIYFLIPDEEETPVNGGTENNDIPDPIKPGGG